MGIYTKPLEKELVKHPENPGYICSVCENKYKAERSKIRCEQWHEATSGREN